MLPDKLEGVSVDLNTDKNQMSSTLTGTATDNGRPVLQGVVDLYFRTSSRILVLHIKGEPDRLFMLKLPANPRGRPISGHGSASTRSTTSPARSRGKRAMATITR